MGNRKVDITGQQFGKWTVLRYAGPHPQQGQATWLCRCECGHEATLIGSNIRRGQTRSCLTCSVRAGRDNPAFKHGRFCGTRTKAVREATRRELIDGAIELLRKQLPESLNHTWLTKHYTPPPIPRNMLETLVESSAEAVGSEALPNTAT